MADILKRDGLSLELLRKLSYQSDLGIRLKKNLHYFDKEILFAELLKVNRWYDVCEYLHSIPIDYRIKSIQSAMLKYDRYYPDIPSSETGAEKHLPVIFLRCQNRHHRSERFR